MKIIQLARSFSKGFKKNPGKRKNGKKSCTFAYAKTLGFKIQNFLDEIHELKMARARSERERQNLIIWHESNRVSAALELAIAEARYAWELNICPCHK